MRGAQKIPTVAQNSTKNRRLARSHLIEWLSFLESSRMWMVLALFPWGDSDPWGPRPGLLNRGPGLPGRTGLPGARGAQPEHCRGPEMVTGGMPGSGARWVKAEVGDLVPLISGCLALWLLRGIMEKSHRLMSDCYCAQHWVVLSKPC